MNTVVIVMHIVRLCEKSTSGHPSVRSRVSRVDAVDHALLLTALCGDVKHEAPRARLNVRPEVETVDVFAALRGMREQPVFLWTPDIRVAGYVLLVVAREGDGVKEHAGRAAFLHGAPEEAVIEVCAVLGVRKQHRVVGTAHRL